MYAHPLGVDVSRQQRDELGGRLPQERDRSGEHGSADDERAHHDLRATSREVERNEREHQELDPHGPGVRHDREARPRAPSPRQEREDETDEVDVAERVLEDHRKEEDVPRCRPQAHAGWKLAHQPNAKTRSKPDLRREPDPDRYVERHQQRDDERHRDHR